MQPESGTPLMGKAVSARGPPSLGTAAGMVDILHDESAVRRSGRIDFFSRSLSLSAVYMRLP